MDVMTQMRLFADARKAQEQALIARRAVLAPDAFTTVAASFSAARELVSTQYLTIAAPGRVGIPTFGRGAADVFARINRAADIMAQFNRVHETIHRITKPLDQMKWLQKVVKPWGEFVPKVGSYPRFAEVFDANHRAAVRREVTRAVSSVITIRSNRGLLGGAAVSLHDKTAVSTVPTWTVSNDVATSLSAVPRGPSAAFSNLNIEGLPVAA